MSVINNEAVIGRYIAEGTLVLESAAHFGSGEEGWDTDLAILRDAGGQPVIAGSALAGVCRSFLTYQLLGAAAFGYRDGSPIPPGQFNQEQRERELRLVESQGASIIGLIFGDWQFKGNDEGGQSALMVYDAYPVPGKRVKVARRDGVKISAQSGQAEDRAKYNLEVIEAGTSFNLRFELVIRQGYHSKAAELKENLGLILTAFENGEIRLGARTRRGLGRGRVEHWRVQDWDYSNPRQVLDWLQDHPPSTPRPGVENNPGRQSFFKLEVTFKLEGSMLVRSYVEEVNQPDAVQLNSPRADGQVAPRVFVSSFIEVSL